MERFHRSGSGRPRRRRAGLRRMSSAVSYRFVFRIRECDMRYSVISKGLSTSQLEAEVKKVGGTDIAKAQLLGQIICNLNEESAATLAAMPGLTIRPLKQFKTEQMVTTLAPVETLSDVFYLL